MTIHERVFLPTILEAASELEQARTASVAVIHSRDGGEFTRARWARRDDDGCRRRRRERGGGARIVFVIVAVTVVAFRWIDAE